jgi:preprotein translocase subunit SecF
MTKFHDFARAGRNTVINRSIEMSKTALLLLRALLISMTLVTPSVAYIGPGAGISVLGSVLGILATIFVAIGAIVFWPIRKFLKRRKAARESADESTVDSSRDAD